MKKVLFLLFVVILFVGGCCPNKCAADNLISYVPAEADAVIGVDAARLIDFSYVEDFRSDASFDKKWNSFEATLKGYGLKKSDLPSKVMIFLKSGAGTKQAGILADTKITEAKLLEIFNSSKDKISYEQSNIAGRKCYVITQKDKADKAVVTYLQPNIVFICDKVNAEYFCKIVGKTKNAKLIAASKKSNSNALLYLLYAKAVKATKVKRSGPFNDIESAIVDLDLVGKKERDFELKGNLKCNNAQNASQMAVQLKTLIMIMNMQFAQNPELSKFLDKAIVVDQKDKDINIKASLPESILKKIQSSIQAQKAKSSAKVALGAKAVPAKAVK